MAALAVALGLVGGLSPTLLPRAFGQGGPAEGASYGRGEPMTDAGVPELTRYPGLAFPSKQVTLSTPIDEVLREVLVSEGQRVASGETVARLDDAVQRASVRATELQASSDAEVRAAEASLRQSRNQLDRLQSMRDRDATSDWEVVQAEAQHDRDAAALDAAHEARVLAATQLDLEQRRLERYLVTAPFDGEIREVHVEAGTSLNRGEPIIDMVNLDPIRIEIPLPAELFGRLEIGRSYLLDAGVPVDRPLAGKLTYIDRVMDPASQTFRFVFEVSNPDWGLPAGFIVTLADLQPVVESD